MTKRHKSQDRDAKFEIWRAFLSARRFGMEEKMEKKDLEEELAEQLEQLNQNDKALNDLYRNYAAGVNLSDAALWVLYVAWTQGEGCTQKDICESWSYPRQTINSALKNLEQQGYLTLYSTPENRKSKRIAFTEAGRELGRTAVLPLLEMETASFGQLSREERKQLVALSQKRTMLLQREMERAEPYLKRTQKGTGGEEKP